MKNKFNIFDLFFRIKRKKEKIKEQEKKEKEQLIINNQIKDDEYFVDPFITPIPFFTEKNDIKNKNDKKQLINDQQNKNNEYFIDPFIDTVPIFVEKKEIKKKKKKIEEEKDDPIFKEQQKDKIIETNTNIDNITIIKNAIVEEVEKNIKEDFYQLNKIKYELEKIKKEEEKELELEEVNNLIIRLDELIKRFEKLKKEFYKKNYDKINEFGFNNKYINDLIQEYKTSLKNSNIVSDGLIQIEQIEEYIDIINNLVIIEEDTHNINNNLESKKEELNIADKDMSEFEQKYTDINKITNYINTFSEEQETIINDIEKKIEESTKITKRAEYQTDLIINYSKLLSSTLLMAATTIIPQTKTGNMLKIGLIVTAVANMTKVVKSSTKETKTTTSISNIDYSKNITSSLESVNDMDTMIQNSLNDIKYMRQSFQNEFEQYKNVMSEYTDMLAKLDSVEKELVVKQKLAKNYESKLSDTLEKNNVKVKRLEEDYKSH